MKNKFYMQEFEHFNGECFIKFNILAKAICEIKSILL